MLAGIPIDVSGSMESGLQLHAQLTDQDVTRARSIFTTIMNIVDREVDFRHNQDVFVLAFGLQDTATCDLLPLLDYIQPIDLKIDDKGHENLSQSLANHGAPYADQYVRKYVSERHAHFLFKFYSQNENRDLLTDVVQRLPKVCKQKGVVSTAMNGGIWLCNFALPGLSIGDYLEEKRTKTQVEHALNYSKDIIRQRSLPRLRAMEKPRTKTFQSTANLLKQVTDTYTDSSATQPTLTSVQLVALVDSIEPFIYGATPICKAMQSALNTLDCPL